MKRGPHTVQMHERVSESLNNDFTRAILFYIKNLYSKNIFLTYTDIKFQKLYGNQNFLFIRVD